MSALARHRGTNATNEDLEAMRLRAWRQQGVSVPRPEEIRDARLKRALTDEANRRHGPGPERSR
jgi:hypothetical protein